MMWEETTHNGRVSFSAPSRDVHPHRRYARRYSSNPRGSRHILYADGDVGSTTAVAAVLQQADASVVHLGSVADCLACLDSDNCHLIVVNVPRPDVEGMDLLTEARRRAPRVPIILMVDHGQVEVAVRAIKAGAIDCIERPPDPRYLRSVIDKALRESCSSGAPTPLTRVELAVLEYFLKGYSNQEVARALKRSRRTIEVHRSSVMCKLQAVGPVDLVRKAIAAGLADGFFHPERVKPPAFKKPDSPRAAGSLTTDVCTGGAPHA